MDDALVALLVPISRLMLTSGVGVHQFVHAVKQAYVKTAMEEVFPGGSRVNISRLSVATGLTRKEVSLLVTKLKGGNVRLAPLYDLASILPYADKGLHKAKLAMKLGGEYLIREIRLSHWKKMATELRLDTDQLVLRVDSFAEQLPELAKKIHQQLEKEGLKHHILTRLTETITERSKLCRKILGTI